MTYCIFSSVVFHSQYKLYAITPTSTSFVKLPFSCLLLCKSVNNTERIQLHSAMVFYRKNRQITETLTRRSTSKEVFDQLTNAHRLQRSLATSARACRPYKHHWGWKKVHDNQLETDWQLPKLVDLVFSCEWKHEENDNWLRDGKYRDIYENIEKIRYFWYISDIYQYFDIYRIFIWCMYHAVIYSEI